VELNEQARQSAVLANWGLGTGLAAAGIGVVLWLTSQSPPAGTAAGLAATASLGPDSGQIALGTRF
jgi:hypothetical protein